METFYVIAIYRNNFKQNQQPKCEFYLYKKLLCKEGFVIAID